RTAESRFYRQARRGCGAPRSLFRRGIGIEHDRLGTGDLAAAGGAGGVQAHFALDPQRTFDHGARAEHHARLALGCGLEPAGASADPDAAADHRADADGDIAVDGFDVAADAGLDQADGAVDGLDVAADRAAAVDEHAAVDGLDAAARFH